MSRRAETVVGEKSRKPKRPTPRKTPTRPSPRRPSPAKTTKETPGAAKAPTTKGVKAEKRQAKTPREAALFKLEDQFKIFPNVDRKAIDRYTDEVRSYPDLWYMNMRMLAGSLVYLQQFPQVTLDSFGPEYFTDEYLRDVLQLLPDPKAIKSEKSRGEKATVEKYKADLLRYVTLILTQREISREFFRTAQIEEPLEES
jgi:hypothetical protein